MSTFTFRYKHIIRELPVFEVGNGLKIAYLDTLSDYELVTALSQEMASSVCAKETFVPLQRLVLFTAENKGIPFAYATAQELQKRCPHKEIALAIARKQKKKFFGTCIETQKASITTERETETLYLPESDRKKLDGSDVILIDDFYSTGASMKALERLAKRCNAKIADKIVAVWETADHTQPPDVTFVATLPVL